MSSSDHYDDDDDDVDGHDVEYDDDEDDFQVGTCFERSRAGRVGGVFSHPAASLKCLGG